ncbi:MAG TPA: hypothetical protein VHL09_11905 [Dehalococcoidia bacterium]|nr:hypothetical protein [Dehalococcoidia bacterium]
MKSHRPVAIDWADLAPEHEVVLVPPTIGGLATAVVLYPTLERPFFGLIDPLDLTGHLRGLAAAPARPSRLIVAGLPLDARDVDEVTARLAGLGGTAIEWYDHHYWSPDAQTALWPHCRRLEIGPDVPHPVHYLTHQALDRAPLGLRMIELVERGTDSTDAWVKTRFRLLAGVLQPERDNLIPDVIASTAAEEDTLAEFEWEIAAEQAVAEKTAERLVREELAVATSPRGTRYLLAELGEWSASPFLALACGRFFEYQVLVRLTETGRIIVESRPSYPFDLGHLLHHPNLVEADERRRATRHAFELDARPDRVDAAARALVQAL